MIALLFPNMFVNVFLESDAEFRMRLSVSVCVCGCMGGSKGCNGISV